jgi:hypothetical protein
MGRCRESCQACYDSAGIASPIGSEQPGEGGHDIDSSTVGNRFSHRIDLGSAFDDLKVVTYPLYQRTGNCDRAFQCITGRFSRFLIGNCGKQSPRGETGNLARIGQEKTPRTVGAFPLSSRKARLTEQGRLLVSEDTTDGNRTFEWPRRVGIAVDFSE